MITPDSIKAIAKKQSKEIITLRRHLHMYPELSFREYQTSEFIASELTKKNITFKKGIAGTGIIGAIKGRNPERKVIALRADMDALPVAEENQIQYQSKNEGIMHACGHDVHIASLLGTARILKEMEREFEGTVLLIFQPGEELLPGGAKLMLEEGALQKPKPQAIIAQHVTPELETGQIGFRAGNYMASNDELHLTINGRGGHAAFPHETDDTVLIAAKIIVALKELIDIEKKGISPTILSFGKFLAQGATNVIPGEVKIEGTFRTFNETWRKKAHYIMTKRAEKIASKEGGSCEIRILTGYPVLVNNDIVTDVARESAIRYMGEKNIVDLDLRMSSEDFAHFAQVFPATLYRIGVRKKGVKAAPSLHSSTFDVDETVLEIASGNMAWIAVSYLMGKKLV